MTDRAKDVVFPGGFTFKSDAGSAALFSLGALSSLQGYTLAMEGITLDAFIEKGRALPAEKEGNAYVLLFYGKEAMACADIVDGRAINWKSLDTEKFNMCKRLEESK